MRADFWTKSPQQKLSDIGPKGSKKVKNCTKLVHFFTRDGRLRSKWTLFTLFGHYFKNTHSRHYVPLTIQSIIIIIFILYYRASLACSTRITNTVVALGPSSLALRKVTSDYPNLITVYFLVVNNYKYLSHVVDNIIFGISEPDYPSIPLKRRFWDDFEFQ